MGEHMSIGTPSFSIAYDLAQTPKDDFSKDEKSCLI